MDSISVVGRRSSCSKQLPRSGRFTAMWLRSDSASGYEIHTKVWNCSSTRRLLRRSSSKSLRVAQSSVPLAITATGNCSPLRLSMIFNLFVVERRTLTSSWTSMMKWRISSPKGMILWTKHTGFILSISVIFILCVIVHSMSVENRSSKFMRIFLAKFSKISSGNSPLSVTRPNTKIGRTDYGQTIYRTRLEEKVSGRQVLVQKNRPWQCSCVGKSVCCRWIWCWTVFVASRRSSYKDRDLLVSSNTIKSSKLSSDSGYKRNTHN